MSAAATKTPPAEADEAPKKPPRKMVAVRLSEPMIAAIKEEAGYDGLNPSEIHRVLLQEALHARATARAVAAAKAAKAR